MYSVASCEAEIGDGAVNTAGRRTNPDSAWNSLLACSASPFTSEHRRRVHSSARSEVDWHAVLSLAEAHGLLPIVYERLLEMSEIVPGAIRDDVGKAFEQNARQTLWLTHLLLNVTDLFQRQGIQALPYKGPVLAQLLYGNVTARQYSDIDILVHAADVPRAMALLEEAGFKTDLQLSGREHQAYLAEGYEFTFHSVKNPNILELQWRILPRFWAVDFDTTDFFVRAQKVRIGERSIPTLCDEDLMLVLCAHAAKHAWCKLSWIRDIAELSQAPDLDWDQIIRKAGRLSIRRIVGVTFLLAMKMLSTPVPTAVRRLIASDGVAGRIADETCHNLQAGAEPDVESLAYFRFTVQLRERRTDRYRFWWRLAATPGVGEWSLMRLPGFLFPLYPAVRVGRLSARLIRNR